MANSEAELPTIAIEDVIARMKHEGPRVLTIPDFVGRYGRARLSLKGRLLKLGVRGIVIDERDGSANVVFLIRDDQDVAFLTTVYGRPQALSASFHLTAADLSSATEDVANLVPGTTDEG